MNEPKKDGESSGGCPVHRDGESSSGSNGQNRQVPPVGDGGPWRPQSSRVGIGPIKYVWWNSFYWIMETLNRGLAFNPYRKVSWDKWPPYLGIIYLLSKLRFNRSNALTDPYDYKANDTKRFGREPEVVKRSYTANGEWVSDDDNPQMGAENTRFGSNMPPRKVAPDVQNMTPTAHEVGMLRHRKIDPVTGREIVIPALILNDLAGAWIQFQVHNFSGNTMHDPVAKCPYLLARDPSENWPGNVAVVDRTTQDPTRMTSNGRPTAINEREMAWIQGQIYGTNDAEMSALRSYQGGKFKLDADGRLPEDPNKPGIDRTGFNNNYSPMLSLMHWLFVSDHNTIAEHLAYFHPDWDDETLFQMARKVNAAQISRIHTIQWTEDLLQHPALQIGMHAEWYGFLGQRPKMYLMRFFHRHPRISCLMTWLRHNELIWGNPGSKWEHHDGPYQVPTQFRMVYRLHEMVLSEHEIADPTTGATLDRIKLLDFVQHNTRAMVAKYGYETLAWSFVRKSCGALTLHNFPLALTRFNNQQDGTLSDLAERDILRERTDGTGTYNQFRESLGEPPVTSFMELTGGDAQMAQELDVMYGGDVDQVDAGIGILVEPKPAGFALGFCQFYQFILNAPRRVKSNRQMTEGYTYGGFAEGMDWIEHAGGIFGVIHRHLPALRPLLEGVLRGFMPWPETETFPLRMLNQTHQDTGKVFRSDLRTCILAAVALVVAVCTSVLSLWTAVLMLLAFVVGTLSLVVVRMLAMRFMQQVWRRCYTDKRAFMFGTLSCGERWINRAAFLGKLGALVVMAVAGTFGWQCHATHPWMAVLSGMVALSSIFSWKWSGAFARDAQVLKVSLRNRMREGQVTTDATTLPGNTALAKRYWFLKGNHSQPVATFCSAFRALKESGLPSWTAFSTTALSLLLFGRKTQRGMTWQQKREAGIGILGRFNIYIPNLIQAQGVSNTRIYAAVGNTKGITPGDVDMDQFELMFRAYAPGRDCLTAYDFGRMREGNCLRDARERRGNCVSRLVGKLASKRRDDQLLLLFSDRVVEEDRKLVPAISKEMLLRFYQGAAQYDLLREHEEGDLDPSPVPMNTLRKLSLLNAKVLARIYSTSQVGEIPDGDSRGKAIFMPGTIAGKIISVICNLLWKGKVFDRSHGSLINKILGMRLIRGAVFPGTSWSDGKPAIIIDYKQTSWLAFFIRDEIRQVEPGLYLGKAYIRLPFGRWFPGLYFALDFRK